MSDALVVNFDDARVCEADVALLAQPSAWLNDACINFALRWAAHGLACPGNATAAAAPGVLLADPWSVVHAAAAAALQLLAATDAR